MGPRQRKVVAKSAQPVPPPLFEPKETVNSIHHAGKRLRRARQNRVGRQGSPHSIYRSLVPADVMGSLQGNGGEISGRLIARDSLGAGQSAGKKWCSGGDSNPHRLPHTPLKRTRLPFRHPSRVSPVWNRAFRSLRGLIEEVNASGPLPSKGWPMVQEDCAKNCSERSINAHLRRVTTLGAFEGP